MIVRHERPKSELEYEVSGPLKLTLPNSQNLTVRQWSLSGVTVPEPLDIVPEKAIISIPFQGVEISFPVQLSATEEKCRFEFRNLGGRERETLSIFYRSLLSGTMSSTKDIITSLDTPVDLVPMGETEEEKSAGTATSKSRTLRAIWNVVAYLAAALVIIGILGNQIYKRLDGIEVQNGRVIAPLHEMLAPDSAYVERLRVRPGEQVRRGDILVVLNDPSIDTQMNEIRAQLPAIERGLATLEARIEAHEARREFARQPFVDRVESTYSNHTWSDFVAGRNLGDYYSALTHLRAFDRGAVSEPGDFNYMLQQFNTLLEEKAYQWRLMKRDLANLKDSGAALSVRTPIPATTVDVMRRSDEYARRGEVLVILEENRPRQVIGWLPQSFATQVFAGQSARVELSTGQGILRRSALIENVTAGQDPMEPGRFGLLVTLSLDGINVHQSRELMAHNAPISITIEREWFRREVAFE